MDKADYRLTRKAVKNINLRVRPDGSVEVSAPRSIPRHVIDAFVESRQAWIEKAQKRMAGHALPPWAPDNARDGCSVYYLGQPHVLRLKMADCTQVEFCAAEIVLYTKKPQNMEACAKQLKSGWELRCREVYMPILESQAMRFPHAVPSYTLKIRDMKSRWGTCNVKKGVVTLSSRLLQYSQSCIAYVALHELMHFFYPNHGAGFYQALTLLQPDWKREKERLREGMIRNP